MNSKRRARTHWLLHPGSAEVAFEIEGTPERLMYCHCSRCRRARSAAHGANLFFNPEQFRWVRGESLVKTFKDPDALFFAVAFCEKCGSGAPRINRELKSAYVPAGALDTDPGIKPLARIFVGSKAPWYAITDDLPQHQGHIVKEQIGARSVHRRGS